VFWGGVSPQLEFTEFCFKESVVLDVPWRKLLIAGNAQEHRETDYFSTSTRLVKVFVRKGIMRPGLPDRWREQLAGTFPYRVRTNQSGTATWTLVRILPTFTLLFTLRIPVHQCVKEAHDHWGLLATPATEGVPGGLIVTPGSVFGWFTHAPACTFTNGSVTVLG
jgi:hypothetical protein